MIELVIRPEGDVEMIYDERLDVWAIRTPTIRRASHVEPNTTASGWLICRRSEAQCSGRIKNAAKSRKKWHGFE